MTLTRQLRPMAGKLILLVYALFVLFPTLWVVNTAFKPMSEVFVYPPVWLSSNYTAKELLWALTNPKFHKAMFDSILVATGNTIVSMILGTVAGYGFSRYPEVTRGRSMPFFLLGLALLPPVALVVPYFFIMDTLNLLDTYTGLIIVYMSFNVPIAAWLMRDYFNKIPVSYEQAARVDGYSRLQTLRKVVLPLALPGVVAATVLLWLFAYTEFLFSFILSGDVVSTYTTFYPNLLRGRQALWNRRMAVALLTILPPVALMLTIRQRITRLF